MKNLRTISVFLLTVGLWGVPFLALAQGFGGFQFCEGSGCTFSDIVKLGYKVIDFIILISVPISAIMFAYAGFLMVSAAGDTGQIDKAKGIFWKVGTGLFFVLAAWLIVHLIVSALLTKNYILVK